MKLNTFMPKELKLYYNKELSKIKTDLLDNNIERVWYHLERAHIIGQRYPIEHTCIHYKMLMFAIKTKNIREINGQIIRLVAGGLLSLINKIPIGNNGRSNVSATKPMPIPKDIQDIFTSLKLN